MSQARALSGRTVERCIDRMAHEISEELGEPEGYALVGIVTGGQELATRLADAISRLDGARPRTGTVDITLYRDDLYTGLEKPILGETVLPFDLTGLGVVLVDDVLFTGRTVRAALDEIMDYGRPRWVKLAVLVDRGHRELPIAPDFVGRKVPTDKGDKVVVRLKAEGVSRDAIEIIRPPGEAP